MVAARAVLTTRRIHVRQLVLEDVAREQAYEVAAFRVGKPFWICAQMSTDGAPRTAAEKIDEIGLIEQDLVAKVSGQKSFRAARMDSILKGFRAIPLGVHHGRFDLANQSRQAPA